MRATALLATALVVASVCVFAKDGPEYNGSGDLLRPENYREWVWMTSGLGMTYGPAAAVSGSLQLFDNVFVEPSAWRAFRNTGKWPDKTQFVLEIRYSQSHGSINKGGAFQTDVSAIEMAVKDGGEWSYYDFPTRGGQSAAHARPLPKSAGCWACHNTNGAVDNTFTQFYPTALDIAKAKGTVKPGFHEWAPSPARLYHTVDTKGWDAARDVLTHAKREEPEAAILTEPVLNLLGYQLLGVGKEADAVAVFRHVTALYPDSANAADSLADALEQTGDRAASLAEVRRALELLPKDSAMPETRRTAVTKALQDRLTRLQ